MGASSGALGGAGGGQGGAVGGTSSTPSGGNAAGGASAGSTPVGGSAATTGGGAAAGIGGAGEGGSASVGGAIGSGGVLGSGGVTVSGGAGGTLSIGGSAGTNTGGTALGGGAALPIGPVVKVDFDMSGRPTAEVTELGFTAWPIPGGASVEQTLSGVKFALAKSGSQGTELGATWQKVAVDAPNYARLVGDGVMVQGGEAGGAIQLTLSGLAAGKHSLVSYHNWPSTGTYAPIDVLVDGAVKVSKVAPSVQALSTSAAKYAYLEFDAVAGKSVVVLFRADTSSSASNKNVVVNAVVLNESNPAGQANSPNPADGDEHVDADSGGVTLSWKGAPGAVSHDVFLGDTLDAVSKATRASAAFKGNQSATTFAAQALSSLKTYYWRIDEVDAQGRYTLGHVWYFRPRHLAFPGAEGYGRFARGGRGGVVVHVTNLNDAGVGSFRDAIVTDRGPRTIVFDVGGIIPLASRLTLAQSYVTVAGQTAPGKGIVLRAAPFGMSGARDVVVQDLRVRVGHGTTYDGMGLQGSDHSIVDHCSISWTIDEAFSSRDGRNISLQRTLISEALNIAGHQNYPAGTAHGYAASIGGNIGSFHHNLLAHCEGRNWSLAGGLDASGNFSGRLDIFNNLVYNWGGRATDGGAHEVNFVANYYKPGGATSIFTALNAQYDNFPGTQKYYMAKNVMPGYFDENNQDKGRTVTGTPDGYSPWVTAAFFPSYATVHSAGDAFKNVLSDVGCTAPVLDDHDVRVVNETLTGTAKYRGSVSGKLGLPDNESDVGGYESYPTVSRDSSWDSDGDGLPGWWEKLFGLNPSSASGDFSDANADADGDGYTQLDDYLQWLAKPHLFATIGTNVSIDLGKAFAGYSSSPTFTASAVVNGTVSISGKSATFAPNKCGLASFQIKVTDGSGSTMSKDMVAFVDAGSGACP